MSTQAVRAITLHQPWAAAVALGWKQIETRHWPVRPGGLLAIHSAKKWDSSSREAARRLELLVEKEQGYFSLMADCPANAHGAIVAVCRLVSCVEMDDALIEATPALERAFGNWAPGRWAWGLKDVMPLEIPVQAVGRQSMWNLSKSQVLELERQIELPRRNTA